MRVYLETDRLLLRQFTPEDVDDLLTLDRDPEVRRYLLMPHAPTREDAERTIARFLAWHKTDANYGYFAAIEKASGAFIGWFHFRPSRDDDGEIEIGYRLERPAWGKGYATEATKALLRKGFMELDLPRVIATALTANRASIRVMEKAGMMLEKHFRYQGEEAVKYALDRATYLRKVGE
jgi:RimJ/RimL family protein N-acetyltransferase